MSISPSAWPGYFLHAVEMGAQVVEPWIEESALLIGRCSPYVQSSLNASLAVVVVSIGALEVSIRIGRLVHKVLNFFFPYQQLSDPSQGFRKLLLGSLVVLTFVSTNYTFYRMLKIPLSTLKITGLVFMAVICCVWWKSKG